MTLTHSSGLAILSGQRALCLQWSQDTGAGVARAWPGRGAGHRQLLAWVARTWRGHGAGVERACPVTPGGTPSVGARERRRAP
eukprot:gene25670-biopygen3010